MSSKNYCRCKACNEPFYPRWHKDREQYEDLCSKCLKISTIAARTDIDLYGTSLIRWDGSSEALDKDFIHGYLSDIADTFVPDTDDPYYEFGEEAFGDLGLFDKYD